ncbi:collagen-like protein [Persicitalea jodogahamensis]|uniref:Collagen-like protein n=1 Tax=Persicitalea jodogahamensis TaxID=402147 RepID=A0A8J3D5K7_9BACT|nr:collagen-like protein [Persicitalea jodogahamensis]GHB77244.1 hypothetical protein GCM10007390_34110 [Persicitalea jodogahamensis]
MKKILMSLSLLATVFLLSCDGPAGPAGFDGPPGPQGPQGPAGPAGPQTLGTVFDVTGNFTTANDFRIYFDFPVDKIEVFDTDVVLVYRLWEIVDNDLPVYRPLPQTVFMSNGAMQYSFDHTFRDVSMFLDTQFDRTTLESKWTTNQTFRVVVIPADFAANGRLSEPVDFNNYDEVSELLQIGQRKVEKYKAK